MIVEEETGQEKELELSKFLHLSKYASFLLNSNFLDEVVEHNMKLGIQKKLFVLKALSNLNPQQLKEWWKKSFADEFLNSFSTGKAIEEAKESLGKWRTGDIPEVFVNTVGISDIIYVYRNRKCTLIKFLSHYTKDVEEWEKILAEADYYIEVCEEYALNLYQEVNEKRLREKSHMLNGILQNIPVIVNKFDKNADVILSVGHGLKNFNYTDNMLVGSNARISTNGVYIQKVLAEGKAYYAEGITEINNIKRFLRNFYFPNDEGGVIGFSMDITELMATRDELNVLNHKLESEVVERTKELVNKNDELNKINNDLDSFIYTASHDLRAPISNIEGLFTALSDKLETQLLNDEETGKIYLLISQSLKRLKETISDLTEIAKIQKNINATIEAINIKRVIEDVKETIAPLIKETGAEITVELNNVSTIKFSKANFKSVLYNLISNAIKYHSPDRKAHVSVSGKLVEGYFLLEVKDNGLGIPRQHQEKLFRMFKRFHVHVEGTGIGLYIVKRIIDNAGGKIEVESEESVGTTFRVYFKVD